MVENNSPKNTAEAINVLQAYRQETKSTRLKEAIRMVLENCTHFVEPGDFVKCKIGDVMKSCLVLAVYSDTAIWNTGMDVTDDKNGTRPVPYHKIFVLADRSKNLVKSFDFDEIGVNIYLT